MYETFCRFIKRRLKTFDSFSPMFCLLLYFCLALNPLNCLAQDLPKIIQPSPDAVSLFRYQTYPVDHSTGLPKISIPLYEVKSGSLSVPIDLSYHASGRRIDDQDGAIALGWSLNAGGVISRTVNGSEDFGEFKFPYPFKTDAISNLTDYIYLEQLTHYKLNPDYVHRGNWKDSEYDVFSYYFGNHSGKFVFQDVNNIKTPVTIPYKPYIITPTVTGSQLTKINIIDDKGYFYEFKGSGSYYNTDTRITNEYSLSSMISPDKADTITFSYKQFNQYRKTVSQTITLIDNVTSSPENNPTGETDDRPTTHDFYTVSRLNQINFRQGKVVFEFVSGSDRVDKIQIFDNSNKLIKSIHLTRSKLDSRTDNSGVITANKLDAIIFKGNTGLNIENYTFEYHPTVNKTGSTISDFNGNSRDWWNFYNASGEDQMIPRYTNLEWADQAHTGISYNYSIGSTQANREPNLKGLQSGVLKKITFPTGGSSEFTYEINRYKQISVPDIKNGPGLRIYQIKNNDKNGTIDYRTYIYGENENGYGQIDLVPDIQNMAEESYYYYYNPSLELNPFCQCTLNFRQRIFYDGFIPRLKELANRPVIYTTVTEYIGTKDDNTGKIIYTYDYKSWDAYKLRGSREDLTIGRWHILDYNYWNIPSLIGQEEYKNIGNDLPYQLMKKTVNSYDAIQTGKVTGLHVDKVNFFPQKGTFSSPLNNKLLQTEPYIIENGPPIGGGTAGADRVPYAYNQYWITTGSKKLSSSSQTIYNDDGTNSTNSTSYVYNGRQLLSTITNITSDNGTSKKQIKYPFDYQGNTVLSQMSSSVVNMLDYAVEEFMWKNSTATFATKTDYFNWGTTTVPRIYPRIIQTRTGTLAYETKIRFHRYDSRGNILSVSKENGPMENYIWSYKKEYPVAKILNVDYSRIETLLGGATVLDAFSSSNPTSPAIVTNFLKGLRSVEAKDMQVSSYAYTPLVGLVSETDVRDISTTYEYDTYQRLLNVKDHSGSIIKSFSYNYNNGSPIPSSVYFNSYVSKNFNKNNCPSGNGSNVTYRVDAKKYFSTISQADADAKAQADINSNGQNYANQTGKCYYKNSLKQKTFNKNNCGAGVNGSGVNYTVAVGKYISMVSQADADAKALAELNAKGQENANINGNCGFHSVQQSNIFEKNNCPANSLPSKVTYTVPAGSYYSTISQADADAKALADLNANGQTYANNNGACRQKVNFTFSNSTSDNIAISFNGEKPTDYTYYVCTPGSSSIILPEGIYNISVTILNTASQRRIFVGSRSAVVGNRVSIENVKVSNIGSGTENNMAMMN